jgi:hypothetical protein
MPHHLRDIISNLKEPVPWWYGLIPGLGPSNSRDGLAKVFGGDVYWYVGFVGSPNTDEWRSLPANMNLKISSDTKPGINFMDERTPTTIYQIIVWSGTGDGSMIMHFNFLSKEAWHNTYKYIRE